MNGETLLGAIGQIDDDLIMLAERPKARRHRRRVRRFAVIAAACAVLFVLFAMASPWETDRPVLRVYAPVQLEWLHRAANCFCYYERPDAAVMVNYRDTDFAHGAYYITIGMENRLDESHGLPAIADIFRRQQSVDEYADQSREVIDRGAADVIFFYGCCYGGKCRYSIDFSACAAGLMELNSLGASCEALRPLLSLTADEQGNSYVFPLALEEYDGFWCVKTGLAVNADRADPGLVADFLEYLAENVEGFGITEPTELSPLQVLQTDPDARCAGLSTEPKPVNIRSGAAALIALMTGCGLCWASGVLVLTRAVRAALGWHACRKKCRGKLVFCIRAKRSTPLIGLGCAGAAAGVICYVHRLSFSAEPELARWLFLLLLSLCGVCAALFASMLPARVERYGDRILCYTGLSFAEWFSGEIERTAVQKESFVVIPRRGRPVSLRREFFDGLEEVPWD